MGTLSCLPSCTQTQNHMVSWSFKLNTSMHTVAEAIMYPNAKQKCRGVHDTTIQSTNIIQLMQYTQTPSMTGSNTHSDCTRHVSNRCEIYKVVKFIHGNCLANHCNQSDAGPESCTTTAVLTNTKLPSPSRTHTYIHPDTHTCIHTHYTSVRSLLSPAVWSSPAINSPPGLNIYKERTKTVTLLKVLKNEVNL